MHLIRWHISLPAAFADTIANAARLAGLSQSAVVRVALDGWVRARQTRPPVTDPRSAAPPPVQEVRRSPSQPLRTTLDDPMNEEAYLQYITPRPKWTPPADFVSKPVPPASSERIGWTVVMQVLDAFGRTPNDLTSVARQAGVLEETARQITTLLTVGRLTVPDEWVDRWTQAKHRPPTTAKKRRR